MAKIKMLTGVVEVGLFCHMAKAAYFGNEVYASSVFLPPANAELSCFSH